MKIERIHVIGAGVLVAAGALYLAFGRGESLPPAQAIDRLIDRSAAAAEEGDLDALMEAVSEDFEGDLGGQTMGRARLQNYLLMMTRREGGVDVEILSRDISVSGPDAEEASATVEAVVVGGGLGGALSGDADARHIELDLRLEDDTWKVVYATHRRPGLRDAL